MALRTADDDPKLNPGQIDSNRKFDALKNAEAKGTADSGSNNNDTSSSDSVNIAEENPSDSWQNNVSGNKPDSSKASGRFSFVKKKGPLTAIILTIVGGGIGIGGLLSPALLTQSILANLVQKFNIQETSLTIRTNKLIASKMSGEATDGSCKYILIACRFTKPSNRFLTKLEANGIKAFDKNGKLIEKKLLFPNTRPTLYKFTNSAGKEIPVDAKGLYDTLSNNAEFRASFHSASNSRFISLTDSVFNYIKGKFNFNITDKLSKAKDKKSLDSEIDDNVKINDSNLQTAAKEGGELADDEVKAIITEEADKSAKKLARAGKGSLINLGAGAICLVTDVPGLITKATRAFRMGQLIKYSMVFLSAFGAIKAGDATPAEASVIGDALTKVGKDGKTAMDSFGMKYSILGDTRPVDDNYKAFIPGGTTKSWLGGITRVTDSDIKKGSCAVMTNPVTGETINVILGGVGVVGAIANLTLGYILSSVIGEVLPPLIDVAIQHIDVKKIITYLAGDITSDLSDEKIGDALVSGASHVMGQTANAGGNMPLSVDDAVVYGGLTKQVQLAYAEEDRATLSPFNVTSPNTILGSIIQKIIPYYLSASSTVGSIAHNLSFMSNIVFGSFSTALQPLTVGAESVDKSQYQLCDDPDIKNVVAAGPYCNIIYGVPKDYLDIEPTTVVTDLIASGDIDEKTGEPIQESALEEWVTLCTNGTTDILKDCKITNKTANYALYTIDHRIQISMDGETDTEEGQ